MPVALAAYLAVSLVFATSAGAPEARYDAVIPQLSEWAFSVTAATVYSLQTDASLYDNPGGRAIATLPARNFLRTATIVVGVDRVGEWERVLTPARQSLPSAKMGAAPAQTSGWIKVSSLTPVQQLKASIVISLSARTLSIVTGSKIKKVFAAGVGAAGTPTPTGVTGYLQARYLDPGQEQSRYPVQLTSLHSSAADEPFGGNDGGLIGIHYEKNASGAQSHGCVRLPTMAIEAVNAMPLGTLVTISP